MTVHLADATLAQLLLERIEARDPSLCCLFEVLKKSNLGDLYVNQSIDAARVAGHADCARLAAIVSGMSSTQRYKLAHGTYAPHAAVFKATLAVLDEVRRSGPDEVGRQLADLRAERDVTHRRHMMIVQALESALEEPRKEDDGYICTRCHTSMVIDPDLEPAPICYVCAMDVLADVIAALRTPDEVLVQQVAGPRNEPGTGSQPGEDAHG